MRARQAFVRACSSAACECCVRVRRSCALVVGASPARLSRLGAFFEEEALAEVGGAFESEALGDDGGGRRALPADLRKAPGAKAPGAAFEDEARAEHDGERRALLAEVSR